MLIEKNFDECGICGGKVNQLICFPEFPLAGKYTNRNNNPEYITDLVLGICEKCNHTQLMTIADPNVLYTEGYTYRTSKSFLTDRNQQFFIDFIKKLYNKKLPVILEIGCNDLSLMKAMGGFASHRIGVDPIQNDFISEEDKLEVHGCYIEDLSWRDFLKEPDLVVSRHNIEHIVNLDSFFSNLYNNSKDSTVFVFEFPDADAMYKNLRYDQIFHQHVHYFTIGDFKRLINLHGFQLISAKYNGEMWGGSWVVAFNKGSNKSEFGMLGSDLILRKYNSFKEKNKVLNGLLECGGDIYGFGAGQMTPILGYHLGSRLAPLRAILDDDQDKDGAYFDYLEPVIKSAKNVDVNELTIFITSVDAVSAILGKISPKRFILPNLMVIK